MRAALAFLTPFGGAVAPDEDTAVWFPAVGALIGLAVGASWWLAEWLWPPLVAATIAVVVDLVLTGLRHVDGLATSADGLLAPMEEGRRLEALAEPRITTFGIVVIGTTLLVRVACLASTPVTVLGVVAVWAAARGAPAIVALTMPCARAEDPAAALVGVDEDRARTMATLLGVGTGAVAMVLGLIGAGFAGVLAPLAALGAGIGLALLARRRIGGFTGEVLGAVGVLGETVGLLILAVR